MATKFPRSSKSKSMKMKGPSKKRRKTKMPGLPGVGGGIGAAGGMMPPGLGGPGGVPPVVPGMGRRTRGGY